MIYKIFFLAVIFACVGPFFIEGPDGKPLLTLDQFIEQNNLDDLAEMADEIPVPSLRDGTRQVVPSSVTVYKWQDEEGIWQFSTSPPNEIPDVEAFELSSDINIVPSLNDTPDTGDAIVQPGLAGLPEGLASIAPDQLKRLMEQVNGMQETVDQRKEVIDEAIDEY